MSTKTGVSRREIVLQAAPLAALVAAGIAPALAADSSGRTDPGPANQTLDGQNADSTWPPPTDSKSLVPTFKYPFSFANKRVYEGGWSREVTVRELPVSKTVAGVNIRLNGGGVRELHWHTSGEWSIMLVETSLLHYIENTGDTDLIFLEMFKSSTYQDFSFSEWLAHTAPELVMAHLNIDRATFDATLKTAGVVFPVA